MFYKTICITLQFPLITFKPYRVCQGLSGEQINSSFWPQHLALELHIRLMVSAILCFCLSYNCHKTLKYCSFLSFRDKSSFLNVNYGQRFNKTFMNTCDDFYEIRRTLIAVIFLHVRPVHSSLLYSFTPEVRHNGFDHMNSGYSIVDVYMYMNHLENQRNLFCVWFMRKQWYLKIWSMLPHWISVNESTSYGCYLSFFNLFNSWFRLEYAILSLTSVVWS